MWWNGSHLTIDPCQKSQKNIFNILLKNKLFFWWIKISLNVGNFGEKMPLLFLDQRIALIDKIAIIRMMGIEEKVILGGILSGSINKRSFTRKTPWKAMELNRITIQSQFCFRFNYLQMDNECARICTPGIEHQTPIHWQWWNDWNANSAAHHNI